MATATYQQMLRDLFDENVLAKLVRTAIEALEDNSPPTAYPEFVPDGPSATGQYFLRDAEFWTCGFFPGLLYLLVERAVKYPRVFPYYSRNPDDNRLNPTALRQKLLALCDSWTQPLHAMATRTDTHDLGFIIQPALCTSWELTGNEHSLQLVLTAAHSLATRYDPRVRAIRSWDALRQVNVEITSLTDDFLVIVDSMCNLDLLYYAAHHTADRTLSDIATAHAHTIISSILRRESPHTTVPTNSRYNGPLFSTCHVVNFDPRTGSVKERRTAQGYSHDSTWARGQAWAILGFAQTYTWTHEQEFLSTACGLAEYFLQQLEAAPSCVERHGRYVPLWDFDAPIEDLDSPLRDSSAGVIAANGMLVLSQALLAEGNTKLADRFRVAAMRIVSETLTHCLANKAKFIGRVSSPEEDISVSDVGRRFDAILQHATANHNAGDHDRYSDHGLVYADYYLVEFGNKLLRMGFA
ncbi:hypothetical protein ASPZODRAFT_2035767 [Penicilliopsis zonata CBS 506.65]|uniref:Glucuronyl hydrolase n=1 Tax=Penicilliopsis zonata CBS 506.65 TaxID=1073090 RepID=A0A1L9SFQ9_9EURO|nr:hypothetical protein ASPZODRAFT_2035767 [Penicilliopsis zonata CBS 506.65]OJJ46019.1 hypothetical protein ASPZODRAFT_2035767 [Penicilliopsis zonata CBS 506.65]